MLLDGDANLSRARIRVVKLFHLEVPAKIPHASQGDFAGTGINMINSDHAGLRIDDR